MRGEPWGAETCTTRITSTTSVPWMRKEAGTCHWIGFETMRTRFTWEHRTYAMRFTNTLPMLGRERCVDKKLRGPLRNQWLLVGTDQEFLALTAISCPYTSQTQWLPVLWWAGPDLPLAWWRNHPMERCCFALQCRLTLFCLFMVGTSMAKCLTFFSSLVAYFLAHTGVTWEEFYASSRRCFWTACVSTRTNCKVIFWVSARLKKEAATATQKEVAASTGQFSIISKSSKFTGQTVSDWLGHDMCLWNVNTREGESSFPLGAVRWVIRVASCAPRLGLLQVSAQILRSELSLSSFPGRAAQGVLAFSLSWCASSTSRKLWSVGRRALPPKSLWRTQPQKRLTCS